jgi:hypothetical protein
MEEALAERNGGTRRSFLVRGALVALGATVGEVPLARPVAAASARTRRNAVAVPAQLAVPDPPLHDAGYWEFADWLQPAMDRLWSDAERAYTQDVRISASALVTHAVAALEGHEGDCRRDERARLLARRLCESPPFRPAHGRPTRHSDPRSESQRHAPGFVSSISTLGSSQHITVDPKVARALYYAWRAREQLELPPATVARIVACVSAVARSPFFRYPNIRLNQINFAAELHACAASMTGDTSLLRHDFRKQLGRFLNGAKHSVRPWRIANLGPSYNFHRNPFQRAGARQNIESAEYANIVLDVIYYYEQARRAGMRPISRRQARTLRAWVARALPAYWTHSGYLNWDTGLYLYRWHLSRYWAWSCQGLLAIASSQNFVNANERRWAKHIFDRALALYERHCERWTDDRREPGSSLYGITTKFSEGRHFELARFQALAAEAVLRGLGQKAAEEPPPLYAFDPLIGRLTVTTPAYNTALVAVSNGAFPYGGIDLARLYDSSQRVVSHIGGRAPAGFGVVVRRPGGKIEAASQRSQHVLHPGRRPIRLTRSPQGPVRQGTRYPRNPYAGRFEVLEAEGFAKQEGVHFHSHYRFEAGHFHVGWRLTRDRTDPLSAEAMLPSWDAAILNVVLKNGQRVKLGNPPDRAKVDLATVAYFYVDGGGRESGYVAVPRSVPPAAFAFHVRPGKQGSNPRPGPSIAVRLAEASRWGEVTFGVAIAPARTADEAAALAAQLLGAS